MKVELLDKGEYRSSYIIRDIDANIANTLRRTIMEEVPVMAVETVTFLKNNSALYDEIVAHRLGLLPLKTDLEGYNIKEECSKCKGKGCASCQTELTIKAVGPVTVYAKDIKSKDPKIVPVYPDMPIVKLLKGQKLECEMIVSLGKGRDHSKYSPALAFYRGYPEIKIKDAKAIEGAKVCPTDVYKVEDGKIKIIDEKKCILCMACVDATDGKIEITGSEKDFIFFLESWGQLTSKEIITKAFDVLDNKLDSFNEQLANLK